MEEFAHMQIELEESFASENMVTLLFAVVSKPYALFLFHDLRRAALVKKLFSIPPQPETAFSINDHLRVMDNIVDSLNKAYQEFVAAAANVLETKGSSAAQKTESTDTALESFKQKWETFGLACDQAEEFVESIKQRIGSECLVDEATGNSSERSTGLPPISAVRLEQMSKAVRWLVIELQNGSGTAAAHPSTPFDGRFSEDGGQ
ncbi:hypothetical protein Goshw_026017 [Gossypium schwendimanii]|uniref:Mediator of RNA polymerase II transcription subunit 32 n=3 Tax=Gossypium TaxID=3633 RepID=A0A7J9LC94_GOSSC|nr:hypothetical protein [Gossypium schwendimanii]